MGPFMLLIALLHLAGAYAFMSAAPGREGDEERSGPPTAEELAALFPYLVTLAERLGVSVRDSRDVAAEAILRAFERAANFVQHPKKTRQKALEDWLWGFCRNIARHHRDRTRAPREIPWGLHPGEARDEAEEAWDPGPVFEARSELETLALLAPSDRDLLLQLAAGAEPVDIANASGRPLYAMSRALSRARKRWVAIRSKQR